MLENSLWIWTETPPTPDSYAEFYESFDFSGEKMLFTVSCDSNYALYINGALSAFGQYACYERHPVADTVDISRYCAPGKNNFALVVWYYGKDFSTYSVGKAGAIYGLTANGKALLQSGKGTLSRKSRAYKSGLEKIISSQLGYSFFYNAPDETDWQNGDTDGFSPSVPIDKPRDFSIRPNEKLELLERSESVMLDTVCENTYIFDLQREEVGFLELEFSSACPQTVEIAYGEYLSGGRVPQHLADRNFSVQYGCRAGDNLYMNPFRRLGCRYLELKCEHPIKIRYAGLRPTVYPLKRTEFLPDNPLDRQIYEICVRTLELCLHEHYEDCPWREQALYVMDSRNQMLCGYLAFNEYKAARASLKLFSEDPREDGLLSLCAPNTPWACIPSFTLHYFTEVDEYIQYSKDLTLIPEVYPRLVKILDRFMENYKDGLVSPFIGKDFWNFYEWQSGLEGGEFFSADPCSGNHEPDLILNTLLILALRHHISISKAAGYSTEKYEQQINVMLPAVHRAFFDEEKQLFFTFSTRTHFCALGNALAILSGVADENESKIIAERLADEKSGLIPATLSMNSFVFDALLKTDREKYLPRIIDKIREQYGYMLKKGATSVWEVAEGEIAFGGAGSLCHGWSAIPIVYYKEYFSR